MNSQAVDPHEILSRALHATFLNGAPLRVIASPWPAAKAGYRVAAVLLVSIRMALMTMASMSHLLRGRTIVFREFWNIPAALFCWALAPFGGRVLFNVNHNLKEFPRRFPLSLRLLAMLGFRFVLFDGGHVARLLPAQVRKQFLIAPFPCIPARGVRRRSSGGDDIIVGMVGDFRAEKGDALDVGQIARHVEASGLKLSIGARSGRVGVALPERVQVRSTASVTDYWDFLSTIDVLIVVADRSSYFARHSGTVMDAIAAGAIPLVPNLPVLRSQVSEPVDVGAVFETIDSVPAVLKATVEKIQVYRDGLLQYVAFRKSSRLRVPQGD